MKVFINEKLKENIKTISELRKLLDELNIECKKNNRIIGIEIDGKYVDTILPGLNENDITRVDISIKSPVEILVEGIIDGVSYLPKLSTGLLSSAESFREGEMVRGIKIFEEGIDGLRWLSSILNGIKIYLDDSDAANNPDFLTIEGGFVSVNKELLSAWENEDYILISDLIEYELVPILERCQKNFVAILDELAGV